MTGVALITKDDVELRATIHGNARRDCWRDPTVRELHAGQLIKLAKSFVPPARCRTGGACVPAPAERPGTSVNDRRQGGSNLCNAGVASLSIWDYTLMWIVSGVPASRPSCRAWFRQAVFRRPSAAAPSERQRANRRGRDSVDVYPCFQDHGFRGGTRALSSAQSR